MKKLLLTFLALVFLAALFFFRVPIKESFLSVLKPALPAPVPAKEFKKTPAPSLKKSPGPSAPAPPSSVVPASANLAIPFAPQAPFADWSFPYKEACEEASVIMVHYYFAGKPLTPEKMKEEILALAEWEKLTFGTYEDTNAEKTARILREYFGHTDVQVRYRFTMEDIKREVAKGHPVILPAAGRLLKNPYFQQPGPVYHMLVVKGFTTKKIITNDPGTRRGADFLYDEKNLMDAIHDYDPPSNILNSRKAVIVVKN